VRKKWAYLRTGANCKRKERGASWVFRKTLSLRHHEVWKTEGRGGELGWGGLVARLGCV